MQESDFKKMSAEGEDPDYAAVIARAKQLLGFSTDTELASLLGLSTGGLANYKKRKSVPWGRLIRTLRSRGISLDALMLDEFPLVNSQSQDSGQWQSSLQTQAQAPPPDPRLAAVLAWWRQWWAQASEAERTWALVQLARAFPEYAEAAAAGREG
jgi:transcriptional regulator with XRE-family HTH domain